MNQSSLVLSRLGNATIPFVEPPLQPAPSDKLREFGRVFQRHRRLIVATVLLLNGVAVLAIGHLAPRYTAEAALIIGPRQQQVTDIKAVLAGLSGESDVVDSELQVLRSRQIARSVVRQLNLQQNPEFNPALAPVGMMSRVATTLRQGLRAGIDTLPPNLRGLFTPAPVPVFTSSFAAPPPDPLGPTIDAFLTRLGAAAKGHSRVIGVSVDSADPVLAAAAANAASEAYIATQLQAKLEATTGAHKWLDDRVSELRTQLRNADEAVEAYRRRTGMTSGKGGALIDEQVTSLGDQIVKAQTLQADVEARLRAAETPGRHAFGLEQDYAAAKARTAALRANMAQLRDTSNINSENQIGLNALQHDADADRTLYDHLLQRSKETQVESGLQQADAQIISYAEPPRAPTFPKPSLILPVTFIASCIVAALLVLAVESLNNGYSSLEQVEQQLGVAAIGIIPQVKRKYLRASGGVSGRGRRTLEDPTSRFGETVRNLYTSLMLSNVERPPKIALIASSLPGEGKTSIALALARLMASCGKRVVVVDCDLHNPRLHSVCNVPQSPGLTDCLSGKVPLLDVLARDANSSVLLVPAGSGANTAPDLLGSEAMRKTLQALSTCCDLILLDSAPLLAVSDTRNLCRLADKTVFVIRWQETSHAAAAAGLRQIAEAGGNIAGCVLSMVNLHRYAKYADTGAYHRRIGSYLRSR